MTGPSRVADTRYHVLVNAAGEFTLWRAFLAVPDGWAVSLQVDSRQAALDFIDQQRGRADQQDPAVPAYRRPF